MIWDALSDSGLKLLEGHTSEISSVAWSFDGKRVMTGSADKIARIWEAIDLDFTENDFNNLVQKRYQVWLKNNSPE